MKTRKIALIFGFLCTVSLPVFSETYTIKFSDLPGGLEIQYEVKASDNKIVGTIKNISPVPIGCNRLRFIPYGSQTESWGNNFQLNLDPGASKDFSWEKPSPQYILQMKIVNFFDGGEWNKDCSTGLTPEFINRSESNKFEWGTITGSILNEHIYLSLENNSDRPIEIDWNESSLIDFDKSAKRIIRLRTASWEMSDSIPNSVVPPRAKLNESIIPKDNYVRGPVFSTRSLIPSSIPPQLAEKTIKDYAGKQMSLVLQLIIDGKKTIVTFDFEVKSMKPIQPYLATKGFG